jgi:aspartyl-tRNA(Asn)/glutamyl-tRNA(Gln) amidotransferase subunit C
MQARFSSPCGKVRIIPHRAPLLPRLARQKPLLLLFFFFFSSPRHVAMTLTRKDIDRIAHLARLQLNEAQSQRMLAKLNGFFGIVEAMRAVDTRGVEPLAHPVDAAPAAAVGAVGAIALRLREDVVSEPDQRALNQRAAPAVEDGLFLVPKVIE